MERNNRKKYAVMINNRITLRTNNFRKALKHLNTFASRDNESQRILNMDVMRSNTIKNFSNNNN